MNSLKDLNELIQINLQKGQNQLTEAAANYFLKYYQIPVVKHYLAHTPEQAIEYADHLGFPLVLKGYGAKLAHKTELGLVHLNLRSKEQVKKAFQKINSTAGDELEAVLIQPQLSGKREFVLGMTRDPQFGPVILFGLGGVLTEALQDYSLRLAPLTAQDALEMLSEIRGQKLLKDFRSEKKVDQKSLANILIQVSEMSLAHPEISEIDINPLLADKDGSLKAVDSLIILKNPEQQSFPKANKPEKIGKLFYPKSVAFVGASAQMGKWGHMLPVNTLSGGFQGKIFMVNPKKSTIAGIEAYSKINEIPEPVDLAVVTIPAAKVMDLIPELSQKNIQGMLLVTSGFSETGEKGKKLEQELVNKAREAKILILGPNTMGICNPHVNFHCTGSIVHPKAGSIAMVSQSGNMGVQLLCFAEQQGIGIRAFSGSGNEAMLTIEDYLDSFATDTLTKTVMLYIESVKNGQRFFSSAKKLVQKKPVILLKGGESQAGNKAAAGHTGAMSSDTAVFEALCKQTGIIKVDWPMDLLDLSAAFSSLPLPRGNKVAIITLGGGWGVVTADLCSKYGLQLPELPPEILDYIDTLLPDYWSRSNPVDLVGERDLSLPIKVLETMLEWDGCDAVINLGILGRKLFVKRYAQAIENADQAYSNDFLHTAVQTMEDFEQNYIKSIAKLMTRYDKPVYGVSLESDSENKTVYEIRDCPYKTLFYTSPEKAVKACAKMYEYYHFLKKS